ncbi:hypothetical protein CR513_37380, partial [Mucuna pruriens]
VSLNRGDVGQELGSRRLSEVTAWRSQHTLIDPILSVLTIDSEPSPLYHGDRHKKLSHIEGNGPPRYDPMFEAWDDEDSLIMTWLWNSMTPEIS